MNDDSLPLKRSDEVVGELLDGEGPAGELAENDAGADRERVARLLFLDALLERVHQPESVRIEDSMRRVMSAIDAEPSQATTTVAFERPRFSRRRWLFSTLSAAAGIGSIGLAVWLVLGTGGGSAQAAVMDALREASRPVDREYRVTIDANGPLAGRAAANQNSDGVVSAALYVQGDRKFAFRHPAILSGLVGRELWLGSNGEQVWFAPAVGPVLVSDNLSLVDQWTEQQDVRMPFLQVTTVLSRLSRDYTLKLLPPEELPGQGAILWKRVHGQRREPATLLPAEIDVWAHPQSGTLGRLVLDWNRPENAIGVRRIEFDLVNERPLPEDWYDYQSRHDGSRRVLNRE